jgi:hypothetical protein
MAFWNGRLFENGVAVLCDVIKAASNMEFWSVIAVDLGSNLMCASSDMH